MCLHTRICIYSYNIYIHIYVHIHLHTCTCVYIRIYMYICMYIYDSICMPWLICKCAMTPSYVSDNLFLCVPWLIAMCAIPLSYIFHDPFICVTWLNPPYAYPPALINHVQYLRAGPAEMPVQNWYTANTSHFRLTDFCQAEIQHTTGLGNKPSTAKFCAEYQILENKMLGTANICTERYVNQFSEIYLPVREHEWLIGSGGYIWMCLYSSHVWKSHGKHRNEWWKT